MLDKIEDAGRKLLGIDDIFNPRLRHIREPYRYLRNRIFKPTWVHHPSNIQIDTHNFCNLWQKGKGCIHCNVKPSGGWKLSRGWMPTDMIQYIIEYWGEHGASSIAPYINGEPMMDERLPWICALSQEFGMKVVVDTNGALYEYRDRLVHPNMREVRFSFSATTPEVYEQVHGGPFYDQAKATIKWFLKNKHPSQYPMLHFITNKYNLHQIGGYVRKWLGKAHIVLFPLHVVADIQTESEKTRPSGDYWSEITKRIVGKYPKQPNRPIDIFMDGRKETRHFPFYEACQGTHSFSVAWNGLLLHCTDIPYSYNYGNIYEHDMLEVWHQRNRAKLNHPACSRCNVRHPKHDEILGKYIQ